MPKSEDRSIVQNKMGVFDNLLMRIKLVLRLMGDKRVNPIYKLIPIGALIYLVVPEGWLALPFLITPIDDVAVLWMGTSIFIELCPPEVVQEHQAALQQVIPGKWHDPSSENDEVIDAEFREDK